MEEAVTRSINNVKMNIGGPFGCVVVREGVIIASGANSVVRDIDPTAHAEINALREACRRLQRIDLSDCEVYSSCEPCPMCYSALKWAGVEKIFYSNTRKEAAAIQFSDDEIYNQIIEKRQGCRRLQNPRAPEAFRLWKTSSDKVSY